MAGVVFRRIPAARREALGAPVLVGRRLGNRGTGRTRTEDDVREWKVARGAAGRLPPRGFPKDNKF